MLWFEPIPWARWSAAALIALGALFVELRPEPSAEVPFAAIDLEAGEVLDDANTVIRQVPPDLLDGASIGDVITRPVPAGEPVLLSTVDQGGKVVPRGWWVVTVALPMGTVLGDDVRVVLLDSGLEVEGVVAGEGSDDPFAAADGGVAVPPDHAAEVARAAADGRLAVLISTG